MKALLVVLLVLMSIVGAAGLWYWHAAGNHTSTFRTVAVERGNLVASISATGTVEPEEVVDVGAQVAGQIKEFGHDPRDSTKSIDYGSPVEQGTVLAQVDDSLYKAQVDVAKANLQRAQADLVQFQAKLRQANRDWQRAQQLGPGRFNAISGLDYDVAQANYESAKSALAAGDAAIVLAKAALKQAEINLGYTTIRSPVKGVIVDRRVNVGQTVVASLNAPSLFLIAKDLRRLQVWASVNEADIGSIYPGQDVRFTVDAFPDEEFRGEVAQIRLNASMTQNVVTFTVVVETDNSSGKLLTLDKLNAAPSRSLLSAANIRRGLLPYLTANLQFEVSERTNVLLVPNTALRWRPQFSQVAPDARDTYAKSLRRRNNGGSGSKPAGASDKERHDRGTIWVEDNGFVRPVKVRIGVTDGSMTEIVSGDLEEGAAVVVGEIHHSDNDNASNPFTPQVFGGKKKE